MQHTGASPGDFKDLLLFLATAGVVVPLFQRARLSPVLGFLAAGVFLGPFGLGHWAANAPWLGYLTVSKPEQFAQLAELGVAFLLFTIGLELSWERLTLMRRMVFGLGALQVAGCTVALALAGWAAGLAPLHAALAGVALAMSSTAVALPVLAERRRLHAPAGRAAFAVLLFQDLSVAPLLIVISLLGGGAKAGPSALLALAPAAIGLVGLLVVGRLVLRPMMRSVARTRSDELFIAATLLVVIGASLAAAVAGLSMALGAFVAGLLLAETEFRHEVEMRVEPFKGLLLGLFFVSVGIGLDLSVVARRPLLVLGLAAAIVVIKALVIFPAARMFRLPKAESFETALALAAGGEFAFVVAGEAMGHGLLTPEVGEAVQIAATLTLFAAPFLVGFGSRYGARAVVEREGAGHAPPAEAPAPDQPSRVLVAGFGRVGRLVGEMLTRHDVPWVALDRSPRLVQGGRHDGLEVFFGDASQAELLNRVGLMNARAVVVTMDAPEAAEAVVASVRQLRPDVPIVARARDARHAGKLYGLGATNAVPETIEASLQLSEAVLVDVGVPMGYVIASIHEKRDEYRALLNRPEGLKPAGRRARRD